MKKKALGRITAASLAAMSAVSVMSVTASAFSTSGGYAYGTIYRKTDEYGNYQYYTTPPAGSYDTTTVYNVYGAGDIIYVTSGGRIYTTSAYGGTSYYTSYSSDRYYYYDSVYYSEYDVYKVNGVYYPTLTAAKAAAGNDTGLITKVADYAAPPTKYFSKITGKYYSTYKEALDASRNSSENVVLMSTDQGHYYYDPEYYYYYNNGYYYNGRYYYDGQYYYYGDPYYYYWLQENKNTSSSSSSSSDKTTATAGSRKGWTSIAKYLSSVSSGSSVSVAMNQETTIPSSVMSALKGRNVTVKFTLKNGVVYTINGKNISTAKEINISTAYNTNRVPTKLVQAAYKKNDAVSTAQISVNESSFGADADITVKFATKRSGCTAKLYRYNSAKGTLSLVDSSKVQENGKVTFGGVTKGGDFVIVLC